jgi:hypothetical protein
MTKRQSEKNEKDKSFWNQVLIYLVFIFKKSREGGTNGKTNS